MKPTLVGLLFGAVLAAGCSDGSPSSHANEPSNAGSAATATSSAGNGAGGAQPGGGTSSGVSGASTGASGAPISGGGMNSAGMSSGGMSSGGSTGMAGNGVMGTANAPGITFTEYNIPTKFTDQNGKTGNDFGSNPGEIAAGPDGNLWFNHQSTAPNAIQSISPTGTFAAVMVTTGTTNIGPTGVTAGPDGKVWYAKQNGLGNVDLSSSMVQEFGVPNSGDPAGIVTGPDGKLWLTEPIHNAIASSTTAAKVTEYPLPVANSGPFAIAVGPDMNLWFTEAGAAGNKIGRITTSGTITEFPIATPASNPRSITKGPDGNIWFTELDGRKIGRVTPTGTITEFGLPSSANPGDIVAGKDGNLWFAEAGSSNSIGRVTPAGSVAEYLIPTASADPSGITAGPDGNIWFSELSAAKIGRISNLAGGGTVQATTGMGGGPLVDTKACTDDTDCIDSGEACGGDVCSWKVTPHVCVLATSGDPGWCTADAKCWCAGEGAKCDATSHACSFLKHGGAAPAPTP
jgi:streptogramin lyase